MTEHQHLPPAPWSIPEWLFDIEPAFVPIIHASGDA